MACNEWNDEWVAELYGELEPAQREALEAHLAACSACRTTIDGLRETRQALHEAAPLVPATPQVVVLRPRPFWSGAWSFAAGAACALVLFGAGFVTGPRWMGDQPEAATLRSETTPATPAHDETSNSVQDEIDALRQRLAQLEQAPETAKMTPDQFQQALDRLEQRFHRERAQDLEYVVRSLTASEVRTGTWMDQTNEALTMLALRQDPRFAER